jgi:cyclophilin family peptidyl-prolyl cis-trans isomerase
MIRTLIAFLLLFLAIDAFAQKEIKIKKRDRKRDIEIQTTAGNLVLRLSDSTPLHRDNFLKLVKTSYYDSILFHRVIKNFMIQAGDNNSKKALAGTALGNGGLPYTLDAEIRPGLFHKKGALAAARMGDDVNPEKKSSGSQFYIVQGRVFTDTGLDSLETFRLKGRKLDPAHREVYKTLGGAPHLDQNYTVFGELVRGYDVLDAIASVETSKGTDRDRPVQDVRIIRSKLVKRKK